MINMNARNTMKKIIMSTICAALLTMPGMAFDLSLSAGETGLRVLTTREAPENFGRALPMGPASLRFAGETIWAVDSIAGKFVEYNREGRELQSVSVKDADKLVIADFAFEKDAEGKSAAIWAVGSEQADVLRIDMTGKIVASFASGLSFPAQLELLPGNRVAVLDQSAPQLVVFAADGKRLREQACVGKGFVCEANGDILFLNRKGDSVALMRLNDQTGEVAELRVLDVGIDAEPSLIMLRNQDEVFISFKSMLEKTGNLAFNLSRFSLAGNPGASLTTAFPAPFINRLLVDDGKGLFTVNFVEENGIYLLRVKELEMIEEASQG